jgi:hypothetical protein
MRRKPCARAALICVVLAACGGTEPADGGYALADSAGVTLVRNPAEAEWTVKPRPTLIEDLRIGTIDGSPITEFTDVVGIDVGSDGRIYVADRGSSNVRVFAPDGSYVRKLGRDGQGPGELRRGGLGGVFVTPTDTVWVADGYPVPDRLVAFTPEGEVGPVIRLAIDARGTPREWAAGPNGRHFVRMESRTEGAPDCCCSRICTRAWPTRSSSSRPRISACCPPPSGGPFWTTDGSSLAERTSTASSSFAPMARWTGS